MSAINQKKVQDSNKKRLESMKAKLDEFKNKKSIVRASLNDLEAKQKKIVFNSDDDDDENTENIFNEKKKPKLDSSTKSAKTTSNKASSVSKKKLLSSSSSSDSDSESDSDKAVKNSKPKSARAAKEEEDTIKMFESKINLDEKQTNKLAYLKTKFSNDQTRFPLDNRFVEDEDNTEKNNIKLDKKQSGDKPSTKEQIKSENLSSLKILEGITGKQLTRPRKEAEEALAANKNANKSKSTLSSMNKIIRFDPTKSDHKVYELNETCSDEGNGGAKSSSSSSSATESESETEAKKTTTTVPEKAKAKKVEEDPSKFYKIEPSLKELFSSKDIFQFKFISEQDKNEQDSAMHSFPNGLAVSAKSKWMEEINFSNRTQTKKDKYFNSSESETESEGEYHQEDSESERETSKGVNGKASKQLPKYAHNIGRHLESKPNLVISFLPDFNTDKQVKDALEYFHRKETVDELKEEWIKSRESLVKEYKKKHKRMLRIKKGKDDEKLLPWKLNSANSNANNNNNNNKRKKL